MFIKLSEALKRLPFKMSKPTLIRAIKRGELPAKRFKKVYLIEEAELEKWLKNYFQEEKNQ